MASPISPGDIITLATGIYQMYQKFADAPQEMNQLSTQVKLIEVLLHFLDSPSSRLDYLKSSEGRKLSELLQEHLRILRRTLRQVKDIGKQWQKAEKNWLRKAPFVVYTMRAVPGLRAQLDEELKIIKLVRDWASQAGVTLGSTALQQIKIIAAEAAKNNKAMAEDEFAEVERKRRAACSALKKSVKSPKPSSLAERKTDALEELKSSGLPDNEATMLSELHQKDLEEAVHESMLTWSDIKSVYTVKPSKTSRKAKTARKSQVHVITNKSSIAKENLKKVPNVAGKPAVKDDKKDKQINQEPALSPKPAGKKHKSKEADVNKLAQNGAKKAAQPQKQSLENQANTSEANEGKKKVIHLEPEEKNKVKQNIIVTLFKKQLDSKAKKPADITNSKPEKDGQAAKQQDKKKKDTNDKPQHDNKMQDNKDTNNKHVGEGKKTKENGDTKDTSNKADKGKQDKAQLDGADQEAGGEKQKKKRKGKRRQSNDQNGEKQEPQKMEAGPAVQLDAGDAKKKHDNKKKAVQI